MNDALPTWLVGALCLLVGFVGGVVLIAFGFVAVWAVVWR